MNYQQFNNFCQTLPATSFVEQWGGAQVWKVGGKVFAVGGWVKASQVTPNASHGFSFKTSEPNFLLLSDQPGFRPAPYLASRGFKWIQQIDDSPEMDDQLEYYLTESHRLVSLGLTKKLQKQLGLNQEL